MGTNQTLTARLRDHLAEHGPCPQTGGHPLRCTKAGFDRGCTYYKKQAERKTALDYRSYDRCLTCKEYPAEVEFLSLEKLSGPQPKERTMATAKTSKGQCELCRQERKSLKKHLDMHVCAVCAHILTTAKNRPAVLKEAMIRFDHYPDVVANLPTTADVQLSDEAKRAAADNGKNGGISPEILGRLDRIEALADKILSLEGAVLKVDLISGGEVAANGRA